MSFTSCIVFSYTSIKLQNNYVKLQMLSLILNTSDGHCRYYLTEKLFSEDINMYVDNGNMSFKFCCFKLKIKFMAPVKDC